MSVLARQLAFKRTDKGSQNIITFPNPDLDAKTMTAQKIYTIANSPRALYTNRKFVTGRPPIPCANIMFDRRVARGLNFAPPPMPQMGEGESAAAKAAAARRRALARKKARMQSVRAAQLRLGSPPPVKGRKHEPVQTDKYLEEIFLHPPVREMCTQTELFLERPVSPVYIPAKTGIDKYTQIYPGDLFDFDMEVGPILEVLVGKTVEQALIEVLEEEEIAALKEQQRKFLEIRAVETCEVKRLIEKERRFHEEKEIRILNHEEGLKIQTEMEERIAAAVLTQGYLTDLIPSVLDGLVAEGVLRDTVKQDVDGDFMPWLLKEVTSELENIVSCRDILSDIVRDILENQASTYNAVTSLMWQDEVIEETPPFDTGKLSELVHADDTVNTYPNQTEPGTEDEDAEENK